MDHDQAFKSVVAHLSEHRGILEKKIKETSRIEADFGMTGDDAEEYMAEFFSKFGVDGSAFKFEEHFAPEACWPWEIFKYRSLKDVTIADLVKAVECGYWLR